MRKDSRNNLLKSLILLSTLFLVVPTVLAYDSIQTSDQQGANYMTDALVINVLHPVETKIGENFSIYASFYNKNGKLQNNGSAECLVGFLSPELDRVIIYEEVNMTFLYNSQIQVTNVDGSFFNELGEYTFNYDCDAVQGGYFHGRIIVTPDGLPNNPWINPTFILLIISLSMLMFGRYDKHSKLFQEIGSILLMVSGVWTLYPGFSYFMYDTIAGLAVGTSAIGIGFYFLVENAFSRDEQADRYQGEKDEDD